TTICRCRRRRRKCGRQSALQPGTEEQRKKRHIRRDLFFLPSPNWIDFFSLPEVTTMYQTNYHRASSVADALKTLEDAEDGKFVSGGMTLIPAMKTRLAAPSDLIDLRHIAELKGIHIAGNKVTIGAGTTHAEV